MAVVGAMRAILSVNSTAFRGGMKGASTSLLGFSGAARATTVAVYRLGGALTAVVGPFIGLYGAIRAMRVAEAFEQEMYGALSIIDDVGPKIRKQMEKVTFDVAYVTKFGMAEAAKGYYYLAQAGFDVEQSLKALPQVAYFAQAGMFDLATATDMATDAQTALGLSVKDPTQNLANLTRVTSVLVKASKLANSSVELYSKALTTDAANAARMAGQSIEEVVAVLAKFAENGIKGEKAGTSYARAMNYLSIQAIENADAYRRAGVAVFDMQGKSRSLVDVLVDLEDHFGSLTDEERYAELGVLGFTKKTIALMNTLLGGEGRIRMFQEKLTGIGNVAKEVSDEMLPPLTAAWEKLKAVMTRWSITNIAPAMAEFGEGLSLLLDSTDRLNESMGGTAEGDMSDRFKAVNMELEGMASWVAYIADLWGGVKIVLKSIETVIEGLLTGAANLVDVLTFSQFDAIDEIAENLSQKTLDSADKVREMWNDPNLGTAAERMVLAQSKKNIEEYRKLRGKETAAGGAPAQYDPKPDFAKADAALTSANAAAEKLLAKHAYEAADAAFTAARAAHTAAYKTATDRAAMAPKAAGGEVGAGGGAGVAGPLEAQMARARRIFDQTRTPLEKFNAAMEDLKTLLDVGAFGGMGGEETYRRAVEGARDAYEKASGKAKEAPGPPTLARMGSQEAYEMVRQNRMGATKEQPVVKELRENRRILGQIGDSMVDLVEISREQTEALQGEEIGW